MEVLINDQPLMIATHLLILELKFALRYMWRMTDVEDKALCQSVKMAIIKGCATLNAVDILYEYLNCLFYNDHIYIYIFSPSFWGGVLKWPTFY